MISRELIFDMIEAGFCFMPTSPGMTRSDHPHWQKAIASVDLTKSWLDAGKSLVFVAMRGSAFVMDIDDPDAIIAKGFDPDWLKGYFKVNTPSGGIHVYGLADAVTDAMPGIVLVFETKGDRESKKIFELKIHAQSTAAPGAERRGQKNKCDGEYKPGRHFSPKGTKRGLPPELLEWLKQNAETTEQVVPKKLPWEFHPEFDEAEFAENEGCTIAWADYIDDAYHIVVENCPHCGRVNTSTPRAAKAKFILGGSGYGFVCHACGIEGEGATAKHQELMQLQDRDYSIWDQPIYVHDDMQLMAEQMDKDGLVEEARDPVEKFKGKIVIAPPIDEPEPVEETASDLKYPELAFPYTALPDGQLKLMVDKACEGGLDPGLICPSIIALVSAMPTQNAMVFTKLQQYVCLLALVGAGKDVSIDRAIDVLGIRQEIDSLWSNYAPSGERSLSHLIGDKPGTKTNPARIPGPAKHCIVTYELEDTLKKSKAETSGVLQAMQHYWDHCNKTFSDGKNGKQVVNCRLSWLTAMPVGDDEIDEDTFRHAWGEGTAHGIADRMIWGFSELKFDGRKSYKWSVPSSFNNFTYVVENPMNSLISGTEHHETLYARYSRWIVKDWAPGVEKQFMEWGAGVGRETFHVRKIAVLVALINFHDHIQQDDWDFACQFMLWQQRIKKAFATGRAKKIHQGEFNETYLKALAKEVEKLETTDKEDCNAKFVMVGQRKCAFIRVKRMSNKYRWSKFGLPLDRTTQQLVEAGEIDYLDSGETDERTGKPVPDKTWVRLMRRSRVKGVIA